MMTKVLAVFVLFGVTNHTFAADHKLTVSVVDADSGQPIPCRVYLHSADGDPHFFECLSDEGTAFRYEKQNWINQAVDRISHDRFGASLYDDGACGDLHADRRTWKELFSAPTANRGFGRRCGCFGLTETLDRSRCTRLVLG